ncbi:RICIN domain-containing protein [Melittangium boletus]|uniref:Alpha-L-arabinofuranosidase II n=1 Tax=Melittangium boletus DSM 14713 TaxID=1294270 RepID=A0A250INF3_9BACT|nr:RICIN domain-containing protein [Melittangium boletus]ATB33275.1 Alpha-L-arabinofuranosidase II precursor [Melittangium boletus DSM 14713]
MKTASLIAQRLRVLLLWGFWLFPGLVHAQSVSNPISDLADPHITFANGYYYLTGTTGPTIHLRRSQTLNGLKAAPLTQVYSAAQGGPNQLGWAPELHFLDGKWYIYYSAFYGANDSDGNAPRVYVIENGSADPMVGAWTLKGYLKASPDYWAIDGTVMVLRGQKYFLWAGKDTPSSTHGAIFISKMSNPWTLTGGRTRLSTPDNQWFAWEKAGDWVNEGPEVMLANGKVFVTYSASMFYTPDYCLGMFTMNNDADDPMNPASWVKSSQPVFKRNSATAIYGPGHNSFFKSPDGKEFWMAYHSRSDLDNGPRTTSVKKIHWGGDGMPIFGVPPKNGESLPAPSGEVALPSAAPIANGVYRLVPRSNTGSVLEVAGGNRAVGSRVQQWQWLDGDAQKWNIQAIGNGYYSITAVAGGLALEVEGCSTSGGAKVRPWMANGAACQQWQIVDSGGGFFRVVNRNSGLVLDVAGGGTANGTDIIQWGWQGGAAQQWRFDSMGQAPMRNDVYAIFNQASGQALDVAGCSAANSAKIEQFPWWGGDCQRFHVTANGDGSFRITPQSSVGRALDLPGCSTENLAQIQQYDWLNNDCQKWYINPVGNGYYNIISKRSGLALDLPGCSNVAPTLLQQYTWLNNACQKWRFEPVPANNSIP